MTKKSSKSSYLRNWYLLEKWQMIIDYQHNCLLINQLIIAALMMAHLNAICFLFFHLFILNSSVLYLLTLSAVTFPLWWSIKTNKSAGLINRAILVNHRYISVSVSVCWWVTVNISRVCFYSVNLRDLYQKCWFVIIEWNIVIVCLHAHLYPGYVLHV